MGHQKCRLLHNFIRKLHGPNNITYVCTYIHFHTQNIGLADWPHTSLKPRILIKKIEKNVLLFNFICDHIIIFYYMTIIYTNYTCII